MSSATNHRKRSHRSEYRARAFQSGRVSVITPSIHKADSSKLIRFLRDFRRKQPQTQSGRVVVGEPVYTGAGGGGGE